jgi:hypothetical protein
MKKKVIAARVTAFVVVALIAGAVGSPALTFDEAKDDAAAERRRSPLAA